MKRQRNAEARNRATTKAMAAKKKAKKVEEESQNGNDGESIISTGVDESCYPNWEELSWLSWDVVDEQMSWGSVWLPFWEVEACTQMYSDVVWDYDIWNLKSLEQLPNP